MKISRHENINAHKKTQLTLMQLFFLASLHKAKRTNRRQVSDGEGRARRQNRVGSWSELCSFRGLESSQELCERCQAAEALRRRRSSRRRRRRTEAAELTGRKASAGSYW